MKESVVPSRYGAVVLTAAEAYRAIHYTQQIPIPDGLVQEGLAGLDSAAGAQLHQTKRWLESVHIIMCLYSLALESCH